MEYFIVFLINDSIKIIAFQFLSNITSPDYGVQIRLKINDSSTSNDTAYYGATEFLKSDSGTAHISVIAGNGDAVSLTSSINY